MITKDIAIKRYENFLYKGDRFYLGGAGNDGDVAAKHIIAHVVNTILKDFWDTPQEAMEHMNREIAARLKLDKVIEKMTLPTDVQNTDYDVIIAMSLGINYNFRKRANRVYDKVLSGEIKKFPDSFFDGEGGRKNLYWIVERFVFENVSVTSQDELFATFANTKKIKKLLKEKRLLSVCKTHFFSSPLDLLVFALGNDYDEFLYSFYQHQRAINSILDMEAKQAEKQ